MNCQLINHIQPFPKNINLCRYKTTRANLIQTPQRRVLCAKDAPHLPQCLAGCLDIQRKQSCIFALSLLLLYYIYQAQASQCGVASGVMRLGGICG